MVHLRASQINGCSLCVAMHSRELKKAGESDDRIYAVAAWREAPWFTDAERAALALTEATTRLADKEDAVPDHVWDEARKHYDETAISGLHAGDRQHQRVEPAQRGDAPGGRFVRLRSRIRPPDVDEGFEAGLQAHGDALVVRDLVGVGGGKLGRRDLQHDARHLVVAHGRTAAP